MNLTFRTKEAIKTALAVTIAYGVVLSLGWEKPAWAGFAVAFVSLNTIGQSFIKAAMRMLGTLLGVAAALFLLGLQPQERWLFMTALSLYIGFCVYMMSLQKAQYFWQVSGFVCLIISTSAGPDPVHAFHLAVLRSQETGVGILVYSVVALLLWPASSQSKFHVATQTLDQSRQQVLDCILKFITEKDQGDYPALKAQLMQAQTHFGQMLEAAVSDTYAVREVRNLWRQYQTCSSQLTEKMAQLREGLAAIEHLDLSSLFENIDQFADELKLRVAGSRCMLDGQPAEQPPTDIVLQAGYDRIKALSPLEVAALASVQVRLCELERLTQQLFELAGAISGFGPVPEPSGATSRKSPFMVDRDGLMGSFKVVMVLWISFLLVIYVDGWPGGFGIFSLIGSLAMAMTTMPQIAVSRLVKPVTISMCFAAAVYFFIMPKLVGFEGLAALIFTVTFAICYLFADPRQALGKIAGLALFYTITSVANHQQYSFMSVVITAMMFYLALIILAFAVHIPFSLRSEKVFLRLLARFFRSSHFLLTTFRLDGRRRRSWLTRWLFNYHLHELQTLPYKISSWVPFIDFKALPGSSAEQIQALQTGMLALSYRLQEVFEEVQGSYSPVLVEAMSPIFLEWQQLIEHELKELAKTPDRANAQFLTAVEDIVKRLEEHIRNHMGGESQQINPEEGVNFYRLLGAFRGTSDALAACIGHAKAVDWRPWHESRFAA